MKKIQDTELKLDDGFKYKGRVLEGPYSGRLIRGYENRNRIEFDILTDSGWKILTYFELKPEWDEDTSEVVAQRAIDYMKNWFK